MTKEQLSDILNQVWLRDLSSDDALEKIWGEPFYGFTEFIEDNGNWE